MPKRQSRNKRHELMIGASALPNTTRPPDPPVHKLEPKVRTLRPLALDAHVGGARAPPLLYDRQQTARLLGGVCVMTLSRMEKAGKLTPIRHSDSPRAHVFYKASEVLRAAGMEPVAQPNSTEATSA